MATSSTCLPTTIEAADTISVHLGADTAAAVAEISTTNNIITADSTNVTILAAAAAAAATTSTTTMIINETDPWRCEPSEWRRDFDDIITRI